VKSQNIYQGKPELNSSFRRSRDLWGFANDLQLLLRWNLSGQNPVVDGLVVVEAMLDVELLKKIIYIINY
jgi:hypothetical protein